MSDVNEIIEEMEKLGLSKSAIKPFKSIARWEEKLENKDKGFEPKCKICVHDSKDEIHRLHELGYSNRDIMRELELFEDFTEQALGRHLNKHYPLSKSYEDKIRLIQEKEIQKAIKDYPPIADTLLDEDSRYMDTFLNKYGFCEFNHFLCELIPKKTSWDLEEVHGQLQNEVLSINDNYSYNKELEITKVLAKLNKCYDCQLTFTRFNYETIFDFIFKKLFNKDVEFDRDISPIIQESHYEKDYLFKELNKLMKKKP